MLFVFQNILSKIHKSTNYLVSCSNLTTLHKEQPNFNQDFQDLRINRIKSKFLDFIKP